MSLMSDQKKVQPAAGAPSFAIVVSRFNEFITAKLLGAAMETLKANGAAEESLYVVHVPGAFEIPLTAKKLAESGRFDAVLCLGCVIRGETPHFEFVAGEAARGIMEAGLNTGVPVVLGVITADTMQQALDRAGAKGSNKGVEAAMTAIEMVNVMRSLKAGR